MPGRREFSRRVRADALKRSGGHCERCTAPLRPGRMTYDHVIPDQLGGDPTLENCQLICSSCDGIKTYQHDIPTIAKAKRREAKHYAGRGERPGALRSRPFPKRPKPRWLTATELARIGDRDHV